MDIASIVPNKVYNDSRVRRSSKALAKKGYNLTVYGFGSENYIKDFVDGYNLIIIEKINFTNFVRTRNIVKKINKNLASDNNINSSKFKKIIIKICNWIISKSGLIKLFRVIGGYILIYNLVASRICKNIDPEKYRIIHAHDFIALICAIRLKNKNKSLKIIWDAHEAYTELDYKSLIDKLYISYLIKRFSKRIDFFITINNSFKTFYKKNFPNLPNAIVIMNATKYIAEKPNKKKSPLRISTGILDSQKILLMQGNLINNRGIEILIELGKKYLPDNWSIIFMGSGSMQKVIQRGMTISNKKREKGKEAILLIPKVPYDDLINWSCGADLGALLYQDSSFNQRYCTPNKLWEYPNANLPVLASNLYEIKKVIKKYKFGIILDENLSAKQLGKLLSDLNDKEIKEMSNNCNNFMKREGWGKNEKKLFNLYDRLNYLSK